MSFAVMRLSILGGSVLLIAGCGGFAGGGSGSNGSGGESSPTTVTFTITGGTPTAVATQVGSGSFTSATLSSGNLTLSLPSGTTNFAVAFVCPQTPLTTRDTSDLWTIQYIYEASTKDGTSFSEACLVVPSTAGTTGTLTGRVNASDVSGADYMNVYAEDGTSLSEGYMGMANDAFSFSAPAGTDRVAVLAYSDAFSLVAAQNFSSQTVPGALNGGDTIVFGAADQVTVEPLTYSGVPSGYGAPVTDVNYQLAGGGDPILVAQAATTGYPALPAGAAENGDYYSFWTTSRLSSDFLHDQMTQVMTNSTSAGPVSVFFPPAWSYAGPTPAASPSFDLSYSGFSGPTGVYNDVSIGWPGSPPTMNGTTHNDVEVIATGNYLNGSTAVAIPDLSGVSGFLFSPASGTEIGWEAGISQGDFSSLQPTPPNATITTVSILGIYTVP